MKKILLSLLVLFACVSVNAASGNTVSNIKIENVDIVVKENVGYNEKITVNYSINPQDAKNLNLVWEVTGTKKGVTVEFENNKSTTEAVGSVVIKVENTLDKDVTLTLRAKQNGKVVGKTNFKVETKEKTIERVVNEINELVSKLDDKIDKENYDENSYYIKEINKIVESNEGILDSVEENVVEKYEAVKTMVNEFDVTGNKTFVLIMSIILIIIFSILIIWIFKKEDE